MEKPLMECGCVAQGTDQDGKPVCVVHIGIHPGAITISNLQPALEGRKAKCCYGNHGVRDSDLSLAFFVYHPDREFDEYYCGCWGWE